MFKKILAMAAIAALMTFIACNDDDDNPVPTIPDLTLHFDLKWDPMMGVEFNPGGTYTTASGDSLIISEVRMWISNVKLYNDDSLVWTDTESFYLVEKTSTKEREMIKFYDVPAGDYDEIEFSVGVDSAHNYSLDQKEGELDENVGMSWNWNTGYKFYVQNGEYFDSDSMSFQPLRLHSGLDTYYVTNNISLPNTLTVRKGGDHLIHVMTANGKTYNMPNVIDVGAAKGEMQFFAPSPLFDDIAENYSTMFMVHHVE